MKFVTDQKSGRPALVPFDAAAMRFLDEQTDGEPIEIEALHPRDMLKHRAIMSQIGKLAKALHRSPEQLRAELLYATGNFKLVGELTDMPVMIAVNSMSRHSMRDHELETFWHEALGVIESKLLPLIDDAAERARLSDMFLPQPA